jgi:probable phosphoglycerate mutase
MPPLRAEHDLREVGQGEWEGLLQAEVEARYPETIAGWRREPTRFHAPGGESLAVADGRARAALGRGIAELAAAASAPPTATGAVSSFYDPHDGPWTILVGHDGIFKVVLMALLGLPLERFWSFTQATTGIAVVDLRNGRAVVRAWNRTEHLAPLEAEASAAERRSEELAADRNRTGTL